MSCFPLGNIFHKNFREYDWICLHILLMWENIYIKVPKHTQSVGDISCFEAQNLYISAKSMNLFSMAPLHFDSYFVSLHGKRVDLKKKEHWKYDT